MKKNLLFIFLIASLSNCFSQYTLQLHYQHTTQEIEKILHQTKLKKNYASLISLEKDVQKIAKQFKKNHYASFSIDSLTHDSLHYTAYLFFGKVLIIQDLIIEGLEPTAYKEIKQADFPLSLDEVYAHCEHIINYLENTGYPFSSVVVSKILTDSNGTKAIIEIKKNNFIQWDSIILKGSAKLSKSFLYAYFDIKPGKTYKESTVHQIPNLIQSLSFIEELQKASVSFSKDKAALYLYLNKHNTNQFDGFLGVVPENANTGKVLITGNINLLLNNVMTIGERILLQWKNPDKLSQNLDIELSFPYLFRTRFGINADFHLYKKDTTYLQLKFSPGLQYNFKGTNYIKLYYQYNNARLIATNHLKEITTLPDVIDYDLNLYGFELNDRKLDYIFNPRKGYSVFVSAAIGKRNIIKNNAIPDELYNNIDMSSLQIQSRGDIAFYFPIKKQWIWLLRAQGASIYSSELFENELFRIGGLQTLRGFIEQSMYASSYAIVNTELRFLFAKKSFLQAFFDVGWYEKQFKGTYIHDIPFGFGLGTAFDTKAGIFSLNYALGRQMDNPISLKTGVVSFGYIAVF